MVPSQVKSYDRSHLATKLGLFSNTIKRLYEQSRLAANLEQKHNLLQRNFFEFLCLSSIHVTLSLILHVFDTTPRLVQQSNAAIAKLLGTSSYSEPTHCRPPLALPALLQCVSRAKARPASTLFARPSLRKRYPRGSSTMLQVIVMKG